MNRASAEIISKYFETTSARSASLSREYYEAALPGLRRLLRGWLPSAESSALDLGCGLGEVLHLLVQSGCKEVVGVNLCQDEVEAARRFVEAQFHCQDILEYLKAEGPTFDWIGAFNILEHLEKEEVLDVLRLCRGRLQPGGVFVAMVPNAISPMSSVTRHWDYTHEWAFTPNNFRQLALLTGFSPDMEFRECGPVPHGVISATRWLMWQLIRAAIGSYLLVESASTKGGVYSMDMLVRLRVPVRKGARKTREG